MEYTNKHAITVTGLGATNYRPARVRVTSDRFSDGRADTLLIGYKCDGPSYTKDVAAEWLIENGYTILCAAETRNGYVFMVNEFISLADAANGKRWSNGVVA